MLELDLFQGCLTLIPVALFWIRQRPLLFFFITFPVLCFRVILDRKKGALLFPSVLKEENVT